MKAQKRETYMAKYKKKLDEDKIYAVRWNMDLLYSAANGNRGSSVSCQQRTL